MDIRSKLLAVFIPLIAIPIVAIGCLAIYSSKSIFKESEKISSSIEKLQTSANDAEEKITVIIESKTILDYKFFSHQLRSSLELYISNLNKIMETLAGSTLLELFMNSGRVERKKASAQLVPFLKSIIENYSLSEINILDNSGREMLREAMTLYPPDADVDSPPIVLPNETTDESGSEWFSERVADQERFIHTAVYFEKDFGPEHPEPVVSLACPLVYETGNGKLKRGYLRLAIPLEVLVGFIFAPSPEFEGRVIVTDSNGIVLTHSQTGRVGTNFDAFSPELNDYHVISHDMLGGLLNLHLLTSRGKIRESSGIVRSLAGAIHNRALEAGGILGQIEDHVGDIVRQTVLITLFALICAVAVVVYMSRRLSEPISRLSKTAIRIASGDLDVEPVAEKNASKEIAILSGNLNEMRLNLKNQIENLDRLVGERTKELEEQLKFLQTMMDTIPNPVFFKNTAGAYLGCNIAFEEFVGLEKEGIVGHTVFDLPPLGNVAGKWHESDHKLLRRGNVQVIEDRFERRDGTWRDLMVYKDIFRNMDGTHAGIVGVILDITDLKRAEEQLVQSEKMAALGGLVAGVAHEINTPVGIGVTGASLLEEETREIANAFASGELRKSDLEDYFRTASESSATILKNLNRASELIQSFKQVAVDQSTEEKRHFKLKAYIDEVLLSLRPKYKRTGHTVMVDCPDGLTLYSYPGAFMQIITNLMDNSLTHGFEGIENGMITLTVSIREGELMFVYTDNGKGMNDSQVKMVFDPFFTTKRARGGTGLGMHIVYNIVTQTLGGRIECSSVPDQKTVFSIRLRPELSDKGRVERFI